MNDELLLAGALWTLRQHGYENCPLDNVAHLLTTLDRHQLDLLYVIGLALCGVAGGREILAEVSDALATRH